MWLWAAALSATLGGLVVVVRALGRVDAAVVGLRATTGATRRQVPEAVDALDRAIDASTRRREALAACVPPGR